MRTTTVISAPTAISGTPPNVTPGTPLGAGAVSHQLATTGTVAGSWKIEVSNKPGVENDNSDASPSDVTAGFQTPAGVAIAAAAGSPTSQFVQSSFVKAGAMRVTFTPTSGAGNVLDYGSMP